MVGVSFLTISTILNIKSLTINYSIVISEYTLILSLIGHINQWSEEGRSAVWLHVPVEHSALISEAVQHGFLLHHTLHNEIVLSRWLDKSRPNKIPHFASHQVGVCGKFDHLTYIFLR